MAQKERSEAERELAATAQRVLPGGGFGNVSHHLVIAEGRGSHVWDVSGAMLEPNLEAVELPVRKQLHPRNGMSGVLEATVN